VSRLKFLLPSPREGELAAGEHAPGMFSQASGGRLAWRQGVRGFFFSSCPALCRASMPLKPLSRPRETEIKRPHPEEAAKQPSRRARSPCAQRREGEG